MLNPFLFRRVIFYLTQDQIEQLHQQYPQNQDLVYFYELLIQDIEKFGEACHQGNWFGVIKLLEKEGDLHYTYANEGLLSACLGGHRDLVDLMIQKEQMISIVDYIMLVLVVIVISLI